MEFNKCFEILSNRSKETHEDGCNCCNQSKTAPINNTSANVDRSAPDLRTVTQSLINYHEADWSQMVAALAKDGKDLITLSNVELTNQILLVQQSRIKLYQYYDRELETIMVHGKLDLYPSLCTKMTEYFTHLSYIMISLKNEAELRNLVSLCHAINTIQKLEKEKLLYIAALHLDQLQPMIPTLENALGGPCNFQKKYLMDKILETESDINEEVENIQAIKLDLLENLPITLS